MVLKITQQTFDDALQENIDILGMEPEEALDETIKQFESQGVDLKSIQTQLPSDRPQPQVIQEIVTKLKGLLAGNESNPEPYLELLNTMKQECDKGMEYKIFAATAGAYHVLIDIIEKFSVKNDVLRDTFKCLVTLTTKHPDLLDDKGANIILSHLNNDLDNEILKQVLKWTKECCVMHEMNRQTLYNSNIVNKLKVLLENENNVNLLRDILAVFRALILDDDVRIEFGKAHEHAKSIASETLLSLMNLMKKHRNDEGITCDLIMTLASLMVRTEFCKQIEETNGLELLQDIMQDYTESEKITRQCFKLLKSLAGNDESKAHIIQRGFAPVITSSLKYHKGNIQTVYAGLLAVSALALRSPENSKAFYEAGLPEVIVEAMKMHKDVKNIQKSGSWAIRNMVSRSRYQNSRFLDLGVEEILQEDLKKFTEFAYDFKAALRDLECEVKLNEEWTGKGGMLHTDSTKIE